MTDHSRQDRTRSPQPNELANLYLYEAEIEAGIREMQIEIADLHGRLKDVRAAIKRACGDQETI